MRQKTRSRRPIGAPTGAFPPNKSAGLSAHSCVTSQVLEAISWAIVCLSRASPQCFSQAPGASRSQHRLSSFLLTKGGSRGCNAVGCANTNEHRPTNTRVASPLQKRYLARSNKDSIVFRLRLTCIRVWCGGVYPHPETNSSPPSPKS